MPGPLPYTWKWQVPDWSKTGQRRHRRQKWTGALILQIEEVGPEVHHITDEPNGKYRRRWRDATVADLVPMELAA